MRVATVVTSFGTACGRPSCLRLREGSRTREDGLPTLPPHLTSGRWEVLGRTRTPSRNPSSSLDRRDGFFLQEERILQLFFTQMTKLMMFLEQLILRSVFHIRRTAVRTAVTVVKPCDAQQVRNQAATDMADELMCLGLHWLYWLKHRHVTYMVLQTAHHKMNALLSC